MRPNSEEPSRHLMMTIARAPAEHQDIQLERYRYRSLKCSFVTMVYLKVSVKCHSNLISVYHVVGLPSCVSNGVFAKVYTHKKTVTHIAGADRYTSVYVYSNKH